MTRLCQFILSLAIHQVPNSKSRADKITGIALHTHEAHISKKQLQILVMLSNERLHQFNTPSLEPAPQTNTNFGIPRFNKLQAKLYIPTATTQPYAGTGILLHGLQEAKQAEQQSIRI